MQQRIEPMKKLILSTLLLASLTPAFAQQATNTLNCVITKGETFAVPASQSDLDILRRYSKGYSCDHHATVKKLKAAMSKGELKVNTPFKSVDKATYDQLRALSDQKSVRFGR